MSKTFSTRPAGRIFGTVLLAALALGTAARADDSLIIGEFGTPLPMMAAAADGEYDKAMGQKIEWRKFGSGTDVIAAMASGDVKLAALGSSPFAIAASQGVPIKLFMISEVIGNSESLVARDGAGIASLADLKGKRVAVPVGSTAHFSLVGALKHAGVDEKAVTILSMSPDQIAAAWSQGAIDAAYIWEPVLSKIMESGKRIVGSDEVAKWGYPTFDGWVVNAKWAEEHPKELAAFVKVTDTATRAYLDDPAAYLASDKVGVIAKATGADPAQIKSVFDGFTFLTAAEQAGPDWLGGSIADTIAGTATFLKSAGRIDSVAKDYSKFVDVSALKAAE